MTKLIVAVLGASLGLAAVSCVAFDVAAARTPVVRRGVDLHGTIAPAGVPVAVRVVITGVTRTWSRVAGSRSAAAVAGAPGSWLRLSRRKARGPAPQIIWCDATGPRGPPVRTLA
ncbi:MAG: hypothetical protein ABJD24_00945 [Acidimicrobiales bacterium]